MPAAEPKPSLDLRRRRFADLVKRVVDAALSRGMSVLDIEKATGVSKSTWYRWRSGNWSRDPRPSEVRQFFLTLGASVSEAYRALSWSEDPHARVAEPIIEDPDVRAVMRALNDPNVSPAVKLVIRRTLRSLANESERPEA
jgi:transcriptional regulator with XRE-family HTH domain